MRSFVLILLHLSLISDPIFVFPQNRMDLKRLRDEIEVTITKYGLDGIKVIQTQGLVISTNEVGLDFINVSTHLSNVVQSEIPAENIDIISWKSKERGYKDKKLMRKAGINGGLIGGAVGIGLALFIDSKGGLRRELSVGYFCNPDENTYSPFAPCDKKTVHNAFVYIPPSCLVVGYVIGRQVGKNIKSYRLEINRDPLRWQQLKDQIPLISIGINLN